MRNLGSNLSGFRSPFGRLLAGGFSPASLFGPGIAGDEWRPEREWCYTRTVGGLFEPVTTTGDFVARHTGAVNGINDEQLSFSKRPSYNEGGGLSWLAYDGIDDGTATAGIDFSGTDKMSVFAGVRRIDATGRIIMELSPSINANAGSFYLASGTDAGFTAYSTLSRGSVNPGGSGAAGFSSATNPSTDVVSVTHDISGDLSTMRVNGVAGTSGTGEKGAGNFGNYSLFTGARNASSIFFNGRNYGRTVIGKLASAPEIAAMEAYYALKSGVTF